MKGRIGGANHVTHGMKGTPTYKTWEAMKARCGNPRQGSYKDYGARGIIICERWLKFENFYEDMGEKPDNTSIDRIDNNGNYEPQNCRWATRTEQNRNSRHNRLMTRDGKTQSMSAWAEEFGISYNIFMQRLDKLGWPFEKALLTPIQTRFNPRRKGPCEHI